MWSRSMLTLSSADPWPLLASAGSNMCAFYRRRTPERTEGPGEVSRHRLSLGSSLWGQKAMLSLSGDE